MTTVYLFPIYEAEKLSESFCQIHFPVRFIKSKKYLNKNDRVLCIGAGYLISEILKCNEKDIITNKYGKPLILNDDTLFFNISHSGYYTVLIISDNNVGVDIEQFNEKHISLSHYVMTDKENHWIEYSPIFRFNLLWTIKESILKLIGTGLIDDLTSIDVLTSINNCIKYNDTNYFFNSFEWDNHLISFTTSVFNEDVNVKLISLDSIIDITDKIKMITNIYEDSHGYFL